MNINDVIHGAIGLIGALGALFGGIAALVPHAKWLRRRRRSGTNPPQKAYRGTLLLSIFLIMVSASIFAVRAFSGQEQPPNAELTIRAWDAINKGKNEQAIIIAERCINEFHGAADRMQAQLLKDSIPLPSNSGIADNEKQTVLARGLLNDVAACFYIKGRAAENLGIKEEARQAYREAVQYTYARCWDLKGYFWSPSEAASDRLSLLD